MKDIVAFITSPRLGPASVFGHRRMFILYFIIRTSQHNTANSHGIAQVVSFTRTGWSPLPASQHRRRYSFKVRCANMTDELELPEHNLSARNGKRTYELVRWVLPLTTPSRSWPHDLFPCSPLPLSIELFCIHRGVRTGGVVRPRPYPTADSL